MKKTIKLFAIAVFTCCFFSMNAQYNAAAGIRLEDDFFLASYKKPLSGNLTGEGFVGIDNISFIDLFKAGIEIDVNTAVSTVEGMNWFYGAGGGLVFGDVNWVEIFGSGGIEYTFADLPLNLSLAILPTIFLGDNFSDNFDVNFALGARYVLGR